MHGSERGGTGCVNSFTYNLSSSTDVSGWKSDQVSRLAAQGQRSVGNPNECLLVVVAHSKAAIPVSAASVIAVADKPSQRDDRYRILQWYGRVRRKSRFVRTGFV